MKKKLLVIFLVLTLVFCSVGLRLTVFRNAAIDSLRPKITVSSDCYYTAEDIDMAIDTVKEIYKNKEWPVVLLKISFDEDVSKKALKGYYLTETVAKENIIVIRCDYIVLKSFAAYSSGYYGEWSAILTRENADSEWVFTDGGYA